MTEEEIESDEMSAIHELWFDITEAPIEGVDAMMKYLNPIKMSADIIVTYLVNFHQLRDVSKEYERFYNNCRLQLGYKMRCTPEGLDAILVGLEPGRPVTEHDKRMSAELKKLIRHESN